MNLFSRAVLAIVLTAGSLLAGSGTFSQQALAQTTTGPACPPGCITEYPVPSPDSIPHGIVVGPDRALWFHEGPANKIGRITVDGRLTEYQIPEPQPPVTEQGFLGLGPDRAIWFTEWTANKLGRITTGGQITEYPLPTPNALILSIITGPDHALWFAEGGANRIGRRAADGTITEYPLPTPAGRPQSLVIGPDGAFWFNDGVNNRIWRMTTSGVFSSFTIPTANAAPLRMTVGPDGAIWFTEFGANQIGRLTTAGAFTEYPLPAGTGPVGITTGLDGAVWFTGYRGNTIGRITADGTVSTYPVPTPNSVPYQITVGPDAALWFTEHGQGPPNRLPSAVHQIGRLQPAETVAGGTVLSFSGPGMSASFAVSSTSSTPGQAYVYFGPGPGCTGLVQVATHDLHAGTTQHSVVVTGNDLPGTVGNIGILPGATYWYEVVTMTRTGTEIDNNGGKCYSVTIPST